MSEPTPPPVTTRITFPLFPVEGWPPVRSESVHGTVVAPGQVRVDNLPFYVENVAFHDVVQTMPNGAVAVVSPSGHGLLRVIVENDEAHEPLRTLLTEHGLGWESHQDIYSIDVPTEEAWTAIVDAIAERDDLWDYQEAAFPLSALDRASQVMYRVRELCVWTKEMTHEGLLPYLVEESGEVIDAVEDGNPASLREELGDLLWQVLFHSAIAQEAGHFDIDDVAGDLADKMTRRHPHVFAGETARTSEEVLVHWHAAKAAEKRERTSSLDGIPRSMPVIARAQKVLSRSGAAVTPAPVASEDDLGAQLLALVAAAQQHGWDAEAALRAQVRAVEAQVRAGES